MNCFFQPGEEDVEDAGNAKSAVDIDDHNTTKNIDDDHNEKVT
jgi:hypothetical protein